jgi:hypothetical protein
VVEMILHPRTENFISFLPAGITQNPWKHYLWR